MQDSRDKLRLGIPVTPPVSRWKIEEFILVDWGSLSLPGEILRKRKKVWRKFRRNNDSMRVTADRPLPGKHTILQLLQSFTRAIYNTWMAQAAKDGGLDSFTSQFNSAGSDAEKV
jgi:hypothetical protein